MCRLGELAEGRSREHNSIHPTWINQCGGRGDQASHGVTEEHEILCTLSLPHHHPRYPVIGDQVCYINPGPLPFGLTVPLLVVREHIESSRSETLDDARVATGVFGVAMQEQDRAAGLAVSDDVA